MKTRGGEYIWFIDGDDYIAYNALEILSEKILLQKCQMLFFDVDIISEDFDENLPDKNKYHRRNTYPVLSGKDMLMTAYKNGDFFWMATSFIIRLDFIKKHQLSFKAGIYFEDVLFTTLAVLRAESVWIITDRLYAYNIRTGSIMRSDVSFKKLSSYLTVYSDLSSFCELTDDDGVKLTLQSFAYDMALRVFRCAAQLYETDKENFDLVCRYFNEYNFKIKKTENFDRVIYYGAGGACRWLLEALPEIQPFEIWDNDADKIRRAGDIKVTRPHDVSNDCLVVICIFNYDISAAIRFDLLSSGIKNSLCCEEFFFAAKKYFREVLT